MTEPEWARDPDAVLAKREKAKQQPSFVTGLAILLLLAITIACEVIDAAARLGGLKAMGWID